MSDIKNDYSYDGATDADRDLGGVRVQDGKKLLATPEGTKILDVYESKAEASEQSIRDPLTGLYNRRYFENQMYGKLSKTPGALAELDVDLFKKINDTYGHSAGDKVLRSISRIIQNSVQIIGNGSESDIVARLGGEEVGIFLPNFTDSRLVVERMEKVRKAIQESFVEDGGNVIKTTVSLGVTFKEFGEPYDAAFRRADLALYKAKDNGRNRCVVSIKNV